jgi:hypothetical protein
MKTPMQKAFFAIKVIAGIILFLAAVTLLIVYG